MTVAELIKQLQELCEDRDPATVKVQKVMESDYFVSDYVDVWLDTAGGNAFPFFILIK
jgi:hypothetical protein